MSLPAAPFLHRQFRSVNFEHRAGKRETVFGLKIGGNEIWSTRPAPDSTQRSPDRAIYISEMAG
jgi:hypothetical protein